MIHHAGCKKGEGRKAQEYQAEKKKPEGDCLLQNNTEMTMPEIAERLELSRTSATRL